MGKAKYYKRGKTKYPGVYYREVECLSRPGQKERVYIVSFRRDGKITECKVGYAYRDNMTPAKAAQVRAEYIEGKRKTPAEIKAEEKARIEAEDSKVTMNKLWDHLVKEKGHLPSFNSDDGRWRLYIKPDLADMDPADITRNHVKQIFAKMSKQGKSEATQRQVFTLIKRIVNLGVYDELCSPLNFKIKMPKLNNARERYLSREEAQKLMDKLKSTKRGIQTYNICLLSLNTGARFGEIANLKWADVSLDQKSIYIGDSKNGYARTVYMNDDVYSMFQSLDRGQPQALVFPSKAGKGKDQTKAEKVMDQISRKFFRALDDLKLNEGIDDARQKICFHSLRHTFASWAVIEGCDIYRLKEVLGHKSIEMTMRYAHLAPDAGRQVVSLVSGYQNGKVVSLDQARAEKQKAVNG